MDQLRTYYRQTNNKKLEATTPVHYILSQKMHCVTVLCDNEVSLKFFGGRGKFLYTSAIPTPMLSISRHITNRFNKLSAVKHSKN